MRDARRSTSERKIENPYSRSAVLPAIQHASSRSRRSPAIMVQVAVQRGRNAGSHNISLRGLQYLIARIAITTSAIVFLYLTIQFRSPTKVSSARGVIINE
jgi:hypothetical protein